MTEQEFTVWISKLFALEDRIRAGIASADERTEFESLAAARPTVEIDDPQKIKALVRKFSRGRVTVNMRGRAAALQRSLTVH